MSIEAAKEFLYRESGDLSIQAPGPALRWSETEGYLYLHLGSSTGPIEGRVTLDAGIVEHLGRCAPHSGDPAWHTFGLSFARGDGWDCRTAATWLGDRLGLRDTGRTACLTRPYRGNSELSSFLTNLLFPHPSASAQSLEACNCIEFVPATGGDHRDEWATPNRNGGSELSDHANGTPTLAPRLARHRGGAGFEVDLGDTRRLDTISVELRSSLPPSGIINLHEARLVVATLESLVLEPSVRASLGRVADPAPHLAVLSLHPAQVELLRQLVDHSPGLAESGLRIFVGLPGSLAHRDCPIVCLSLTRSHSSRAVPFSDDPRDLVLALTRATERLLVFGDPGTMVRRSQWFGALDHLNETTGPIEQAILTRLLAHLPEREGHARTDRALESSGV